MTINVVLVDRHDNVLGIREKLETHHNPVPLHRAVSVVIFDKSRKKMLLQKRSSKKPVWPGFWSNAACTHPLPDETCKDAAYRSLFEEMGVKTELNQVFRIIYRANLDEVWGEHELDYIFIGMYDGKVTPDPSEVGEYKWMEKKDLMEDVKENPQNYTPWFKLILQNIN